MGQEHKKIVKTFMGKASNQKPVSGKDGNGVGSADFERGVADLPKGEDRTPKNGYAAPGDFQDLRNSTISKGSI